MLSCRSVTENFVCGGRRGQLIIRYSTLFFLFENVFVISLSSHFLLLFNDRNGFHSEAELYCRTPGRQL